MSVSPGLGAAEQFARPRCARRAPERAVAAHRRVATRRPRTGRARPRRAAGQCADPTGFARAHRPAASVRFAVKFSDSCRTAAPGHACDRRVRHRGPLRPQSRAGRTAGPRARALLRRDGVPELPRVRGARRTTDPTGIRHRRSATTAGSPTSTAAPTPPAAHHAGRHSMQASRGNRPGLNRPRRNAPAPAPTPAVLRECGLPFTLHPGPGARAVHRPAHEPAFRRRRMRPPFTTPTRFAARFAARCGARVSAQLAGRSRTRTAASGSPAGGGGPAAVAPGGPR